MNLNSFDLDQAVKNIKTIADIYRCVSCDQLDGPRVRYPCGHSVCEICVLSAEDCLLCFSPPDVSTHIRDGPLSLRVKNASNLLHTFQDLFKLDVYRRQRISDQLKLEKQLFPECIQAPSKYFNKSSNISLKRKENIKPALLPGEKITEANDFTMDNTMNYVLQWLNKSEISLRESKINLPRKPFTDLNVNGENVTLPKPPNKVIKRNKVPNREKTNIKLFNTHIKDKSKLSLKKRKKKDVEMKLDKDEINCNQIKCEKNESGIVIEDEILIINDSQSYDKDEQAWLAVIEADENSPCNMTDSKLSKREDDKVVNISTLDKSIRGQNVISPHLYKVPFYKKSSLVEVYNPTIQSTNQNKVSENVTKTENVTITIDNSSFVTTIKFLHSEVNNIAAKTKHSVEVQTETNVNIETDSDNVSKTLGSHILSKIENTNVKENIAVMTANKKRTYSSLKESKCLIIDDSDTDSDIVTEKDSLLEVTADVHRSGTEIVLSQLEQGEYEHRIRHAIRGHTPGSTDSSDKENYDPNKAKRQKFGKKCCSKKY